MKAARASPTRAAAPWHAAGTRLLLLFLFAAAACDRDATGKVVRVIDGDTIEVLIKRKPVWVRLNAIDAPEVRHGAGDPGQPFAQASRQSLGKLVESQTVTVNDNGTDQNGRMRGTVYIGEVNVNAEQVRLGMAWVDPRSSLDPVLLILEHEAREARRGLWADPRPVPPWEYRHSR
jgi:endonuclease YncB( thermonuclease family)